MERFGVVGNPIDHSRSPRIHQLFAAEVSERIRYDAILSPLEDFEKVVEEFFAEGGRGLNVTLPFKGRAFELADAVTSNAARARAVNTLLMGERGRLIGANTDGYGLLRDLSGNLGWQVTAAKVLVIGAGGAAAGVLGAMLAARPSELTIANRTLSRAQDLAERHSHLGKVGALALDEVEGPYDVIVNGTSASLGGELPSLPNLAVASDTCGYDMMYGPGQTTFNGWLQASGCRRVADGLGMLVEQAALSYDIWRRRVPATQPVIAAVRAELEATR